MKLRKNVTLAVFTSLALGLFLSAKTIAFDNPLFLEKILDPLSYNPAAGVRTKSICGVNDLQHIEAYDGRYNDLLIDQYRLAEYGAPVGAMKFVASAESSSDCSGILVGPNQFLTASHCVKPWTVGTYVAFGYQYERRSTVLRPNQHFFQIKSVLEDGADLGLDYAVLLLDGQPGNTQGGFPGARPTIGWNDDFLYRTPDAALIVQHPSGQPKQMDAGTEITLSGGKLFYSDIDTRPGSSGAAVLDNFGMIAGVHTNGGCDPEGGSNSGVAISEILKVSKVLNSPRCVDIYADIENSKFESDTLTAWPYSWGRRSIAPVNAHSGERAGRLSGKGAISRNVNVDPNSNYMLRAWVKVASPGDKVYLGMKNYSGPEARLEITSTTYEQGHVTFSTDADDTSVRIFFWSNSDNQEAYIDDVELIKLDPSNPSNLVVNHDFETCDNAGWEESFGDVDVFQGNAAFGRSTGIIYGLGGFVQTIHGLKPNTDYVASVYGRIEEEGLGQRLSFDVKYPATGLVTHGVDFSSSTYQQKGFNLTTDSSGSVTLICQIEDAAHAGRCDNFSLVLASP